VIDPGIAQELKLALVADTDPSLDERLANVAVALEAASEGAGLEETLKTPSPFEGPLPPRLMPEHIDTISDRGRAGPPEITQKSKAPPDLMAEQSLPAEARARIERRIPVVERFSAPRPPPVPATPPATPPSPSSSPAAAERTALDLAAALGMAPEPRSATPRPERRLAEPELRVPDKGAPPPELRVELLELREPAKKRDGLRAEQLATLARSTGLLAKLLPVAMGILVLLATVALSLSLLRREERQEHVELRFLAIGDDHAVATHSEVGTPVNIETEPPGLLVMFNRQVLGKTPFNGRIPVELEDKVAVELSSPYFERWLGEVRRGPAGDYTITVDLTRRGR
jgi:hypothetical protein